MEITEVRIKLMEDSDDRLQAFCSITFDDCFVVRDLKIIDGTNGPFVAMPSRKLTLHCYDCGSKNHLRANFCNQCGKRQHHDRGGRDHEGRAKLYADIAHPINSECREMIQNRVIQEFSQELERAKDPSYVSRYDDDYDDFIDDFVEPSDAGRSKANRADSSRRQAPKTDTTPAATTETSPGSEGDEADVPGDQPVAAESATDTKFQLHSEESQPSGPKSLRDTSPKQDPTESRPKSSEVDPSRNEANNDQVESDSEGATLTDSASSKTNSQESTSEPVLRGPHLSRSEGKTERAAKNASSESQSNATPPSSREQESKPRKPEGGFGAGIFD